MNRSERPHDIEDLWEYANPSLSEERFRSALNGAEGDYRLELLTQIARTFSLRGRFAEAHAALDAIEAMMAVAGALPRTRFFLERGRTYNSNGDKEQARIQFQKAWDLAQAEDLTGLAVDAAHMLAIVSAGTPKAMEWNETGLRLARRSEDSKARALIPAMLNNGAWELHGIGRYEEALSLFEEARAEWALRDKPGQTRVARWSVARCMRSLGRYEEALLIQRELEAEHAQEGTEDGYVFEEIAENLAALGNHTAARAFFKTAHELLSKDACFVENERDRLSGLRERSER